MSKAVRQIALSSLLATMAVLGASAIALGQAHEEVIISDTLEPSRLEVASGTVVTWRNTDGERHRVRSREGPVEFDSGNLAPGEIYIFTFTVEGTYPYLDHRNDEDADYFGTVVVGPADPDTPLLTSAEVTLIDESFQPPVIEVATDATVEWVHIDGDDQHTVTSTDGAFDSGIMENGDTFTQTFASPGMYPYFCAIHPDMRGTITVSLADGEEPPVEEPPVEEPPVADQAVSIVDLAFEPPTIEVETGATVTWTNDDIVDHTVTATEGGFDSGTMGVGAEFSQAFEEPGSYDYFCAIHPSMVGTVVVSQPTEEPPSEAPPEAGTQTDTAVDIIDFVFEPSSIEVATGATVTWSNGDVVAHTVTATDGAFDSGTVNAGETFSQTFETPGTFDYFCEIHPSMQANVTVSEPGSG